MNFTQIAIFVFGVSAVYLVGRVDEWKKWGFVFGLLGQPFWIYNSIITEQWGILAMCGFYTYSWAMGFYNNWIKK